MNHLLVGGFPKICQEALPGLHWIASLHPIFLISEGLEPSVLLLSKRKELAMLRIGKLGLIHLLLVIAVISLVVHFFRGHSAA